MQIRFNIWASTDMDIYHKDPVGTLLKNTFLRLYEGSRRFKIIARCAN